MNDVKFVKIKCPNCNDVKRKGTLLECEPTDNGIYRVKCKKCNTFMVIEIKNGKLVDFNVEKSQ